MRISDWSSDVCSSDLPITATFVGDASLSGRPMGRVVDPLSAMGADISASPGGRLPLMVRGLAPAIPLPYPLPMASAQVKRAVLPAGLHTPAIPEVIAPLPPRTQPARSSEERTDGAGWGRNEE